jgi:fumarate reductase (CoM/CoB) subunit A
MKEEHRKVKCDVLIIGSGAAGCSAAISAAERTAKVVIINKGTFGRSGTTCLGGAVYAAALDHAGNGDTPECHFMDTVIEGRYIGNQTLDKVLAEESPRTVYELERFGVPWYKKGKKRINPSVYDYLQTHAPPHRHSRGIYHNEKTGKVIQWALCKELLKYSQSINVIDDIYIWSLVVNNNRIKGALGFDLRTGALTIFSCKAMVLATGGAGSSYKVTDMDTGATGDGYSMAFNASAELIDMEFTQFFPTAFVFPESIKGILVPTSPLWKAGLKLYNDTGERFMETVDPELCENQPRDILSRQIFLEIIEGRGTSRGGIWLETSDIDNWEKFQSDHPRSFIWPKHFGVDSRRFEIAPTYHFTIGGIRINEKCETNILGLYAAGEVAGGVHGANRIAGNALAECVVFGQIAGKESARFRNEQFREITSSTVRYEKEKKKSLFNRNGGTGKTNSTLLIKKLRETMYEKAGMLRDRKGLEEGIRVIDAIREQAENDLFIAPGKIFNFNQIHAFELLNMLDLCQLVVKAALMREESRGAHYRTDFPCQDDKNWFKNIVLQKKEAELVIKIEQVRTPFVHLPLIEHENG